MDGFHWPDLLVVLVIAMLIFGPGWVQSMARNAGKTVRQAKTMKEQVMAELPIEEISQVTHQLPQIPLNSHQAMHMLLTPPESSSTGDET
jgi:TatA/E family protein of Tat protein translocase